MAPPKKSKRFEYNLESALKFRELRENQEKENLMKLNVNIKKN